MESGPKADSIWNPMESYGIPCYIYREGKPVRAVCKYTTDEFHGTKPRYRPDLRTIPVHKLCYTPSYLPLKDDLLKRGYPERVIDLGISIANAKCRQNQLNPTRNDTLSEVCLL